MNCTIKLKIFLVGILTSLTLQSCDCWIIVNGHIIDSQTKDPVIDAQIEFLNVKSTDYSKSSGSRKVNRIFKADSLGRFSMVSNNYGFCPDLDIKIKIWKDGYKTREFVIGEDIPRDELNEITITLEKQ
jgi:hypothetical protein